MNTNEFYKQLMNEYSFDHETIKKVAMGKITPKKKAVKTKRNSVLAACFSVSAAAAAVAVTVGVTTMFFGSGNPVTVTSATPLSTQERFNLAMDAYNSADENTEEVFLYVTFTAAVTPEKMQSTLASADDTGNIRVTEVYFGDGNYVSGSEEISALFEENAEQITAVKVFCPGNLLRKLISLENVYLVETQEAFESEDFSVIDPNGDYEGYPNYSAPETDCSDPVIGDTTPPPEPVE